MDWRNARGQTKNQEKHDPDGEEAVYKKALHLSQTDQMEEEFEDAQKNVLRQADEFFSPISKDEQSVMRHTKAFVLRRRLEKDLNITHDFRKRFISNEYGNYEKYKKSGIETVHDNSEADIGDQSFLKNAHNTMTKM